ncbi:transglutaminase family protein [Fodinicola feengrottensis]|uniref:Transglutaminase family protein n=1 Tax=Fodinicola feengrottensis TaxID=435914 RepID=A0ABN2G943_9ACTN
MTVAKRQVRVGCEFQYTAEIETATVFQVQALGTAPATVLKQEWASQPVVDRHSYLDLYGNGCQRLTLPVGDTTVRYEALVMVPDASEEVDLDAPEVPAALLPDDVLVYTLPSRYCLPDALGDEAWRLFGDHPPGYRRVRAICDHVNSHLRFSYGSSNGTTTAADAYAAGWGVCRDFAHVAISFCRALSIPARYVFGYLPFLDVPVADEPMDFAAWMEVYLDGRWWTFDPRNNVTRKGRVLIGRGRDAVDVAMATTYGGPELRSMEVWADEA